MDATSDGVWDWNIQTGDVYYSPSYAKMLGYETTAIPAHVNSWLDLIHPDDKEKAFKGNLDCIEYRIESFAVEFRMQSRNGDWKWILGRGHAVSRDDSGRAMRLVGTHQDITERKRAEENLLVYKAAVEQSMDGIALTDMDGHIRFVNKAWAAMHGYTADELAGSHLSVFHTPEQVKYEIEPLIERLRVKGSDQGEFGHAHKDGSTIFTQTTARVLKGEDGKPDGLLSTARDITKEVKWREQSKFHGHFRTLTAETSARLVLIHDNKTFDEAVDYMLASLGQLFNVDRSYLLRFSDDLSTMTNTHEWYAPNIPPQIDRIQNFPTGHFPWWMRRMKELRPVHIPDVEGLPEDANAERKEFQFQGIQSVLCLPIYNEHGKLIGFMGFDAVRSLHDWPMEQIVMLQMLAEILGSVIFRMEGVKALANSELKFRLLFETMAQGVIYQAADGTINSANPAAEKILGLTFDQMRGKTSMCPRWEMIKEDGTIVSGPEHPAMVALNTGETIGPVIRGVFHPEKGSYIWLSIIAIPLYQLGESQPFQVYATFDDITERKQAEEALQASEQRYRNYILNTPYGLFIADKKGRFLFVNPAACALSGYSEDELLSMKISDMLTSEARKSSLRHFRDVIKKGRAKGEYGMLTKNGDKKWWSVTSAKISNDGFLVFCHDITLRKQAEDQMLLMSTTDDLTGLWNRRYFMQALGREMDRAMRYGQVFSVLMMDIDNFKRINDDYGHDVGDQALRHFSATIQKCLRQVDILGRLGGEEFGIILPQTDLEGAHSIAERLRNKLERSLLYINEESVSITVSIGLAAWGMDTSMDEILKMADDALYMAKNSGRNKTVKHLCIST